MNTTNRSVHDSSINTLNPPRDSFAFAADNKTMASSQLGPHCTPVCDCGLCNNMVWVARRCVGCLDDGHGCANVIPQSDRVRIGGYEMALASLWRRGCLVRICLVAFRAGSRRSTSEWINSVVLSRNGPQKVRASRFVLWMVRHKSIYVLRGYQWKRSQRAQWFKETYSNTLSNHRTRRVGEKHEDSVHRCDKETIIRFIVFWLIDFRQAHFAGWPFNGTCMFF